MNYTCLVVYIIVLVVGYCIGRVDSQTIVFGQSSPLSGHSSPLGTSLTTGIMAAFQDINNLGGVNGRQLQLLTVDDGSNAQLTATNTEAFIANDTIIGLLGYIGTTSTLAVLDTVVNSSIPFIGAFTGSALIRSPFHQNVINLRASCQDEANALVNFAVNILRKSRISVLFQNDNSGQAGYLAVKSALEGIGSRLRSASSYPSQTLDVEAAVETISNGSPEAIVMIGSYQPLAKFVKLVKASPLYRTNVVFLTVSFVGSVPFTQYLGDNYDNVYITQVVPLPTGSSGYKEVQNYQKAMQKYYSSTTLDFISLEGYLIGKFVASVAQRIMTVTRKTFLNAIYDSEEFFLGGLRVGPYERCIDSGCSNCNQGLHQVWLTKVGSNSTFSSVPDGNWHWDTCASSSSSIKTPILFGQSAVLTGTANNLGRELQAGIQSAFEEYNQKGGFRGRTIQLVSIDDGYDPDICLKNTVTLVEDEKVFGLIGYVGTPTTIAAIKYINNSIPLIGAYTGAEFLRTPFIRNVINIRSSYLDETAAMVNFLLNIHAIRRISILYQDDDFGQSGLKALTHSMSALGLSLQSSGKYERDTLDLDTAVTDIATGTPEAIVMVGTAAPLARFVQQVKSSELYANRDKLIFITLSFVCPNTLSLKLDNPSNVYVTQVVPNFNDMSIPLVSDYRNALNETKGRSPGGASMEGYIAGKLVTQILEEIQTSNLPLDRSNFLDTLYKTSSFSLRGVRLGPFKDNCQMPFEARRLRHIRSLIDGSVDTVHQYPKDDCCNSGLREVIVLGIDGPLATHEIVDAKFEFPLTCQSDSSSISDPLIFALPTAADTRQQDFNNAVEKVFNQMNEMGGIAHRMLLVKYYETGQQFLRNYDVMKTQDMIFGIMGLNRDTRDFPTMANYSIPLIGMRSGDSRFKEPYNPLNVILRPLLSDEVASIAQLAVDKKWKSLAVIVDPQSEYWSQALEYFTRYMKGIRKLFVTIEYSRHSSIAEQLADVLESDAVVIFAENDIAKDCTDYVLRSSPYTKLVLPYDVDHRMVVASIQNKADLKNRLVVTEIFPWRNSQEPVFSFFSRDMDTFELPVTSDSLEGYKAAKLVIDVLESINEKVTKQVFIDTLYDTGKFNIGGYVLGPIGKSCVGINPQCMSMAFCSCNQLGREVHHNIISDTIQMSFSPFSSFKFKTCGVVYPQFRRNYLPVIIVSAVIAVCLLVLAAATGIVVYFILRQRKMKYAPKTGLMTICFTDVQNSTVLWEVNAKEMQRALAIHNKVMRALIKKHKGFEIKTQGDSFMVAFVDPCSAILWACEVQETMINQNWSSELLGLYDCRVEFDAHKQVIFKGLRVRIGIHYGEAERVLDPVTRRFDYFGTTVNKAARCEGEARGGQILISEDMFRMVEPILQEDTGPHPKAESQSPRTPTDSVELKSVFAEMPGDIALYRKKGSFFLKGLKEETKLYEIVLSRLRLRTYDEPTSAVQVQNLASKIEKQQTKMFALLHKKSSQVLPVSSDEEEKPEIVP